MKKFLLSGILFFGLFGTHQIFGQIRIVGGAPLAEATIPSRVFEVAGIISIADIKENKITYFPITTAIVDHANLTLLSGNCDYNVKINKDIIICEIINDAIVKTKTTIVVINYY